MTWFHNLKTKTKLVLGFSTLSLIGVAVGLLGIQSMGSINDMLARLYERDMLGLAEIKEANINLIYVGRAVRAAVLADDKAEIERHGANIDKYLSDMLLHMDKGEKTLVSEEAKAQLAHIRENLPDYRAGIKKALELAVAGKDREANDEITKARAIADRFDQAMTAVSASKEKLGHEAFAESGQVHQRAVTIMIAVLVVGTLFGIGMGYWIAQAIARPLSATVDLLRAVAGGDMTRTLEVQSKDEVGQMAAALNETVGSMRSALMEVRSSADGVSAASQELAAAAEELSSGAQEQAASLEEVASSLEEMTATVKQNADSSRQASTLSGTSRSTAENGGEVVTSAVQAMGEINAASKRIADIITAIDEIAFQTNLLALNAAVEAARAGEQGRGFAVVAGEVRNLAQRSATAAKEIKTLINDSVRKVENGSDLVNQSGKTLHEIVTSVKRVNDIVTEISAASQEQAGGIEQVNKAMVQIDQVTQATVSQTEELSSTAQSMSAQAEQMLAMVARFRLDLDSELRRQAAAPRAAEMKKPVQKGGAGRSSGSKLHLSRHSGANGHSGNGGSNGHVRSSGVAVADLEPPAGAFSEF